MAQLTKKQMLQAFNYGDMETVHKELTRYAVMTYDKSFDIESGHYMGANRLQKWEYKNLQWESLKINGIVERLSYTQNH